MATDEYSDGLKNCALVYISQFYIQLYLPHVRRPPAALSLHSIILATSIETLITIGLVTIVDKSSINLGFHSYLCWRSSGLPQLQIHSQLTAV